MSDAQIRKEVEESFRNARMKIEVTPADYWGFYVNGYFYWRPTRKMAVAKAKRLLQAKLLHEQRVSETFNISEEDLP